MDETHRQGMGKGGSYHAFSRGPTLSKSSHALKPGSSLNPVLLGFGFWVFFGPFGF